MKQILKLLTITVVLLSAVSCASQKENGSQKKENSTATIKQQDKTLSAQGYILAQAYLNTNASCPIHFVAQNETLDPINAKEFAIVDKQYVWIKLRRLRLKSRCNNYTVIEIEDLKIR